MQIRRVIAHDGGNHVISDELQFRKSIEEPWTTVPVVSSGEAYLDDLHDGTELYPTGPDPFGVYASQAERLVEAVKERQAFLREADDV